ncbi:MAG TPA: inosine monophosphate cyclohydrolase [Firmicutes bacterium]|nr:inosine monophosphate cyclohydrolase [Bacillota bacterium]
MDWKKETEANIHRLRRNEYPGRGIVIGLSPDGNNFIQVYWLMGRSAASRNRILVPEGKFVKTAVPGEEEQGDPSLLLYYPVKHWGENHIVTNGDQTETIYSALQKGTDFAEALAMRTFEPDPPHYTPRISGLVELKNAGCAYRLAIIKTAGGSPDCCTRQYFHYEKGIPGIGHCIHTYAGNGNPLPSFQGEPFAVKVFDDPRTTARYYWELLHAENKVALLAKAINRRTGESSLEIINKLAKEN